NSRRSRSILPDSRSTHTTNISRPSSVAVVIQIWLPQIAGVDQPFPWIAVFHLTFFDSLQVIGTPVARQCPSHDGPRNSGQLSDDDNPAASVANNQANVFIIGSKTCISWFACRFGRDEGLWTG